MFSRHGNDVMPHFYYNGFVRPALKLPMVSDWREKKTEGETNVTMKQI